MITGYCDPWNGPLIRGYFYVPRPIGLVVEISWLVDTGSPYTCLMPTDIANLGIDRQIMDAAGLRREDETTRGVGGPVERWTFPAGVGFAHDDGQESIFDLRLSVLRGEGAVGLPSVLGRDILYLGSVALEGAGGAVTLDLPPGVITLP